MAGRSPIATQARRAGPCRHRGAASPAWRLAAAAVIGLALAAIGPAHAQMQEWRIGAIDLGASSPPRVAGAWHEASSTMHRKPKHPRTGSARSSTSSRTGTRASLATVALYRTRWTARRISRACLMRSRISTIGLAATGEAKRRSMAKCDRGDERRSLRMAIRCWCGTSMSLAARSSPAAPKRASRSRGSVGPDRPCCRLRRAGLPMTPIHSILPQPRWPVSFRTSRRCGPSASLEPNRAADASVEPRTDVTVAAIGSASGFCAL